MKSSRFIQVSLLMNKSIMWFCSFFLQYPALQFCFFLLFASFWVSSASHWFIMLSVTNLKILLKWSLNVSIYPWLESKLATFITNFVSCDEVYWFFGTIGQTKWWFDSLRFYVFTFSQAARNHLLPNLLYRFYYINDSFRQGIFYWFVCLQPSCNITIVTTPRSRTVRAICMIC